MFRTYFLHENFLVRNVPAVFEPFFRHVFPLPHINLNRILKAENCASPVSSCDKLITTQIKFTLVILVSYDISRNHFHTFFVYIKFL